MNIQEKMKQEDSSMKQTEQERPNMELMTVASQSETSLIDPSYQPMMEEPREMLTPEQLIFRMQFLVRSGMEKDQETIQTLSSENSKLKSALQNAIDQIETLNSENQVLTERVETLNESDLQLQRAENMKKLAEQKMKDAQELSRNANYSLRIISDYKEELNEDDRKYRQRLADEYEKKQNELNEKISLTDAEREALRNERKSLKADIRAQVKEKNDRYKEELKKKHRNHILIAVGITFAVCTLVFFIWGYNSGRKSGRTDGYKSGYSAGYDKGSSDGYDLGHDDGYRVGRNDGYRTGYKTCYEQMK